MTEHAMETISEAIARLERRGFDRSFSATTDGLLQVKGEPAIDPGVLIVDETVRFEGQSDPGDESILFALSTRDGRVRGIFVTSFGTDMPKESVAAVHKLAPVPDSTTKNRAPERREPGG